MRQMTRGRLWLSVGSRTADGHVITVVTDRLPESAFLIFFFFSSTAFASFVLGFQVSHSGGFCALGEFAMLFSGMEKTSLHLLPIVLLSSRYLLVVTSL